MIRFCNVRTFKSRELHDGYRKLQAPDLIVFFFLAGKNNLPLNDVGKVN